MAKRGRLTATWDTDMNHWYMNEKRKKKEKRNREEKRERWMFRGMKTDREKDHCCNNRRITKSDRFDPSWQNYDVIIVGWKRRGTANRRERGMDVSLCVGLIHRNYSPVRASNTLLAEGWETTISLKPTMSHWSQSITPTISTSNWFGIRTWQGALGGQCPFPGIPLFHPFP